MKYSKLFTKTTKDAPKDEKSINAKLLIRGGFIFKELAGVYDYLPLGLRVFNKISSIIREEMDAIGGQEVLMTTLQNPDIWKESGRWSDEVIDVWFRTRLANDTELGLANTHEEAFANMMSQYISSYKDLPCYVYQLQNKFRNELRAKSGIMRAREFIMKDLYSFSRTQDELDQFYEQAKQAYMNIFARVGLQKSTFITFASGGAFSKFSHEFQTISPAGEDTIYLDKDKKIAINQEVYTDEVLAELGLNRADLIEERAIEVGNIFKLGTKYAKALGLKYTDESGKQKPVVMGSYGIGPGRLMGTVVELNHDERGIIWPKAVAPYEAHLIGIRSKQAEDVYQKLIRAGVDVLFDDRNESPGMMFADYDLIGIPVRLVVSEKTGEKVEYKDRSSNKTELLELTEVVKRLE